MLWVEEGNAYVLANIRGAGNMAPNAQLHCAKILRSFDDLCGREV
jgi:prolyl oligopeptidase PreP (S9A serine peptidase family)